MLSGSSLTRARWAAASRIGRRPLCAHARGLTAPANCCCAPPQALNSIAAFAGVSNHTQWVLAEVLGDHEWAASFLQQNQRALEGSYDSLTGKGWQRASKAAWRSMQLTAAWSGTLSRHVSPAGCA